MMSPVLPPIGMLAELTHRCPLQCAYCSNPVELLKANREMDTAGWLALFDQAADLGVLQVHLSGGEPTLRTDLAELVAGLAKRGVYTNLITAGVGIAEGRIEALADAGLDHIQLSFQGAFAATTEKIGNARGAHEKKLETARCVRAAGLPLTINAPIHRHNMEEVPDFIDLALELGAERLEIANVQYAGWALVNRKVLMPEREAVERQVQIVEEAQERLRGIMTIDFVTPDYFAVYPKPCMGGWARDAFMVAPDGTVLPCHAAASIDRCRAFRRNHRINRMFEHVDPIRRGNGDGTAGAAFADDDGNHGHFQVQRCRGGPGDGFRLSALFRRDARKGAGRIDERDHRKVEPVGQVHDAHGLAVAFGHGHAKIVLEAGLRVVALFLADDGDGLAVETGKTGLDGFVLGKVAVTGERREIGEQPADVIDAVRTVRMAGDRSPRPSP